MAVPSNSVASELGVHEHTVGKWRRRFLESRIDGLLDEARAGRPRTINDDQVAAVIERTLRTTPAMQPTGRSAQWRLRRGVVELDSVVADPRPAELRFLQPLGVEANPRPVPPGDLDPVSPFRSKDIQGPI